MNRDVFNANYPAPLIAQFNWYAQTLVIDNHSATAYLYVPAAKRYIAPLQMGAIVNIPSAQSIEVDWQNPPNINSVGTDGDLATVTAYSDILHPANGNTSQVAQGDVTSVFGRTGAVVAETGDYTAAMVGALADDATVGGDLSGTVPDPKVSGLQGVPISATAPTSGEALVYNGSEWAPGSTSAPVTSVFGRTGAVVAETGDYTAAEVGALADNATVGGDLTGTVPDPKVSGLQGVPISATAPTTGQLLEYNGTEWTPTTPAATTNAGELQGVPISTTAPTNGQVLAYDGSDWIPTTESSGGPLASVQDVEVTGTTAQTILSYTPTAKGNFKLGLYFRVVTATTTVTLEVTYTDASGAQTITVINALSEAVGSYSLTDFMINAESTAAIEIIATAGTADQLYVSASIGAA